MSFPVVDGYRLIDGPPTTADYLELRVRSGLSAKTHADGCRAGRLLPRPRLR